MKNILKISDATALGFHALKYMAENPDNLVSVKEISNEYDVSSNHLSKVLQKLVKSGLVESLKGYNGGFRLIKAAGEVSLLDVYEAIEGEFNPPACFLNRKECKHKCSMGSFLCSINKQVEEFFKNKTLDDI